MPFGYLTTLLVIGTCTALALRPFPGPRPLALASFALGQLVNELPQLAALLLVGSTAVAIAEGDVDPTSGLGLVMTLVAGLTLLGLGEVARRAATAPRVLARALESGLGRRLPADGRPRLHVVRALVGFVPVRPRSVIRVADVRYGPHRRHRLDVHHRRDREPGAPVLVYWHGGGYLSGGKHREARALLHRLAARGWVCIDADYRLRPEAGFREHVDDARAAVAWAREHAHEFGGDPADVVLAGSSAGAHLASLLALGHAGAGGGELDAGPVSAVVGLYGYYGRYYGRGPEEAPPSTPLALDAGRAPAMLVVDAGQDTYVGTAGGEALAHHVAAGSPRPVARAVLPGAQHAFDVYRSLRFEAVVDAVEAFLAAVVVQRAPAPGGSVVGAAHESPAAGAR